MTTTTADLLQRALTELNKLAQAHETCPAADIRAAAAKAYGELVTTPEDDPTPTSVRDAVLGMRDTFLQLVAAYNHVGCYTEARDAQAMAIVLHEFEEKHNITIIAYPLHTVVTDENTPALMGVEGHPILGEDL